MGYHPLEKCYGYMYAQGIVEKHKGKITEIESTTKTIPKETSYLVHIDSTD